MLDERRYYTKICESPTDDLQNQKGLKSSADETDQAEDLKKSAPGSGTRVFKKCSPNSKITVYLGKRDYIDYGNRIDPIDGVVLVDPEYVKDKKVIAHILAAFRYGREDLDVLGLTFRKDLYISSMQVYPPLSSSVDDNNGVKQDSSYNNGTLTSLQERLIKKLGDYAYPFFFELPGTSPTSVTLQPAPDDTEKPCGVDYELKTYVVDSLTNKECKRSSVTLAIRKLTYAPDESAPQPSGEVVKEYRIGGGNLRLEASLDKEKYYHGESIAINVVVDNNTTRNVKKIRIQVIQISDIMLFSRATYKCLVAELESDEGCPIVPNQTGFCKVFYLTPLLANNRDKRGLALDGKLKHEDTNLASSAILKEASVKENLGIIVSYKVKVRLVLGFGASDLCMELPFTLTHPKPPVTGESISPMSRSPAHSPYPADPEANSSLFLDTEPDIRNVSPTLDASLISIDTSTSGYYANQEEDFIFEDFARLRLKGCEYQDSIEA